MIITTLAIICLVLSELIALYSIYNGIPVWSVHGLVAYTLCILGLIFSLMV
jgi:hypothetical protein